jgi:Complex 1 protein (LYR family)
MTTTALQAYRNLLRVTRDLFRADHVALRQSRAEIRSNFEKSKEVKDLQEIRKLVQDALEAEEFIKRNLVQARLTKRGTYAVTLKDPDAGLKKAKDDVIEFQPIPPQVAMEATKDKSPPIVVNKKA